MILLNLDHPFGYEMECLARMFYPGVKLEVRTEGEAADPDTITTRVERTTDGVRLSARLTGECPIGEETVTLSATTPDGEIELALGRLLYTVLSGATGITMPWGILTGVRPVRICTARAEAGQSAEAIRQILKRQYLVSPKKINLAMDIAAREQSLLADNTTDSVSLYISIPFCPSRCLYCSFVSHDLAGAAKLVPDYVKLLCREIRHTGGLCRELGLRLQTVYMGGGTPTTLSTEQLEQIMTAVGESFDLRHLREYTVEAGRPDTITREKLETLRRMGADRISINPQTMDDEILAAIGRKHTARQIHDSYALAREVGFSSINMDLIAGLPGDIAEGFAASLAEVVAMKPENITVHTLTVKRSSRLREDEAAFAGTDQNVGKMLEDGGTKLNSAGYRPYYLYRQKGTVQNLENTGYALPGHEGLYNILIMEEVQTILAVGAGAVTKLYRPDDRLQRIFNFKFPFEYISRFDEMIKRKDHIKEFFIVN